MHDYPQIKFVKARNAHKGHRVVLHRGPGKQSGDRTFYARQGHKFVQPSFGISVGGSSTVLGRLTTGQLVDAVAQIVAALMPLPAAPNVTNDADTDAGNTILYQSALAQRAKREDQVRTLGNLIIKLLD
jgi:hypothetical protein